MEQQHKIEEALDHRLIAHAMSSLENQKYTEGEFEIRNTNRAVGTMLSGEIAKLYGEEGLPEDTIVYKFRGSSGQSFAAFGMKGLTMILTGDSNDYVGKGLSGAKIIIKPYENSYIEASENIIVGNIVLYGATSGEIYINGLAGERFAVRNSGAMAVVEGIGDHGCEYMTGGTVLILGRIGKNFAAGMSGGVAYIYSPEILNKRYINRGLVEIDKLEESDLDMIEKLINRHIEYTNSPKAMLILKNWNKEKHNFYKIIPRVYKKILENKENDKNKIDASFVI